MRRRFSRTLDACTGQHSALRRILLRRYEVLVLAMVFVLLRSRLLSGLNKDRIWYSWWVIRKGRHMHEISVSRNIIPVSELKTKTAHWLRRLRETPEPLVITQNGRAAAVLLSPAAYDELTARLRLMTAVEDGLADVEAGRVSSHQDVVAEARRRFGPAGDE